MLVLLLALLTTVCVSAIPTGMTIGIGINAVNNFKNVALPVILEDIGVIPIGEIQVDNDRKGYLHATVTISNLVLGEISVDAENSEVNFMSPNSIDVNVTDIQGAAHFSWSYSTVLSSERGSGRLSLKDTIGTIAVDLYETDMLLNITVTSVEVDIGDIEVQFSGNLQADKVNMILGAVKNKLLEVIEEQLNENLKFVTQSFLNDFIQYTSPPIISFGEDDALALNYSLSADPYVTSSDLSLYFLGQIVDAKNPTDYTIEEPVLMPSFNTTGRQVQIQLSQYSINSGLFAAVNAGLIYFVVTNSDLGSNVLNTNFLDTLLPGIKAKYGANQECELQCTVAQYPSVKLLDDNVEGTLTLDCGIYVISAREDALELGIATIFAATFDLKDWTIQITIQNIEVTSVTVISSSLSSTINVTQLKIFLNGALKLLLPTLGESLFGSGISLPELYGVDLRDSDLIIEEGYLYVEATPNYDL
mmetsp:Transcript_16648/g.29948  ORF Transcript_16648/g.29948 Transcript_16648/m.29948 type:complete len:475 (-) Transcript_16648:33-1457(-)